MSDGWVTVLPSCEVWLTRVFWFSLSLTQMDKRVFLEVTINVSLHNGKQLLGSVLRGHALLAASYICLLPLLFTAWIRQCWCGLIDNTFAWVYLANYVCFSTNSCFLCVHRWNWPLDRDHHPRDDEAMVSVILPHLQETIGTHEVFCTFTGGISFLLEPRRRLRLRRIQRPRLPLELPSHSTRKLQLTARRQPSMTPPMPPLLRLPP